MTNIGGIILAAGASARMLRPKALLPWGSSTFVQEIAKTLRAAGLSTILVVIRDEDTGRQIAALTQGLATAVINPDPARGMLSSLQVGAAALLAQNITQALITPVDQPQLQVALCQRLCEALRQRRWAVAAHGQQWGHPYAAADLSAFIGLDPALSAQQTLRAQSPLLIEGGPQVLFNLNTPAEYQRALSAQAPTNKEPST